MPCLHSSNLLPRGLEGCVCMDGEEGKTTYFLGYDAVGSIACPLSVSPLPRSPRSTPLSKIRKMMMCGGDRMWRLACG